MMKFSLKHGLGLLAGLLLSVVALASESVPIEDRDAFEKEYLACFMSGLKDDCFVSVFSGHLDPRIENPEENLRKSNRFYLDDVKISPGYAYKIHLLEKVEKAGIFDSRIYLIEQNSSGGLLAFHVVFTKRKGDWYIGAYGMRVKSEEIYRILGIQTLLDGY
jgi:hypothetical protein